MPIPGFTIRSIAELALQRVGVFSTADTGPDDEQVKRAADWMNVIVREAARTGGFEFLISQRIDIPLSAGVAIYPLYATNLSSETNLSLATEESAAIRGDNLPPNGVMFVETATLLQRATGREIIPPGFRLIRLRDYTQIDDKDQAGTPLCVYVDNAIEMQARVWPVPAVDDTWSLRLHVRMIPGDMTDPRNERRPPVPAGFERWCSLATAYDIGNGPVTRLHITDRNMLREDRDRAFDELQADGSESGTRTRVTVYNDLG